MGGGRAEESRAGEAPAVEAVSPGQPESHRVDSQRAPDGHKQERADCPSLDWDGDTRMHACALPPPHTHGPGKKITRAEEHALQWSAWSLPAALLAHPGAATLLGKLTAPLAPLPTVLLPRTAPREALQPAALTVALSESEQDRHVSAAAELLASVYQGLLHRLVPAQHHHRPGPHVDGEERAILPAELEENKGRKSWPRQCLLCNAPCPGDALALGLPCSTTAAFKDHRVLHGAPPPPPFLPRMSPICGRG